MAYADYNFYCNTFMGDTIPEASAEKWLERASDYVDTITYMRTVHYFPSDEIDVTRIKKAVCAIAETLFNIDLVNKSVTPTVQENGQVAGAITSISSGRESISYTNGNNNSMYALANASQTAKDKLLKQIAVNYLAHALDSNGQFLIYRGIDNVRQGNICF